MFLISPPLWTSAPPPPPPLAADAVADIVVVGAGVAGMTAAILLQALGLSVLILEATAPGGGMTGRSTAHISNAVDDGWRKLLPRIGRADARLAAQAYAAGIALIDTLQRTSGIPCDFALVDGYLAGGTDDIPALEEERAAAQAAGIGAVWLAGSPFPGDPSARAVRFPGQARLHPLKYIAGLCAGFTARGGVLRQARVRAVEGGHPARVFTDSGRTATARHGVVLANNAQVPFSRALPQKLCTSYTFAAPVAKGAAADAVMWDLDDPYHYLRLQPCTPEEDLLLVGGADHAADEIHDPAPRFMALEAWARRRFPALGAVTARWSGNIKQTPDNLAYCGRWPWADNIFVMDGDGGLGFAHAAIGAGIIRGAFSGDTPDWARLFDPARNGAGTHPLIAA